MFFNLFTSPITTYNLRKDEESKDILAGNLFTKIGLGNRLYKSLLQTVAVNPKKKHIKKIISHMIKNEKPENIDPEIFDMLCDISIEQSYPIFLGTSMKYFL